MPCFWLYRFMHDNFVLTQGPESMYRWKSPFFSLQFQNVYVIFHRLTEDFIRHVVFTAHPDLMQCGLQKLVITQYISQEETNISINRMFHQHVGATYGQMVLSKFSGSTCFPDGSMFTNNVFPHKSDPDMGQTQS